MIYFRAICENHQIESKLYSRKIDAVKWANAHFENNEGPHGIKILEVYVPNSALQIISEEIL